MRRATQTGTQTRVATDACLPATGTVCRLCGDRPTAFRIASISVQVFDFVINERIAGLLVPAVNQRPSRFFVNFRLKNL